MIIQRRGGNNAREMKGGGRDKDREAGGEAEGDGWQLPIARVEEGRRTRGQDHKIIK